jgi:hypothetical protein
MIGGAEQQICLDHGVLKTPRVLLIEVVKQPFEVWVSSTCRVHSSELPLQLLRGPLPLATSLRNGRGCCVVKLANKFEAEALCGDASRARE